MRESQVLLTDGKVVFPGFSGFRPPLMNDWLDISEILLKKGRKNPNQNRKSVVWHQQFALKAYSYTPGPIDSKLGRKHRDDL